MRPDASADLAGDRDRLWRPGDAAGATRSRFGCAQCLPRPHAGGARRPAAGRRAKPGPVEPRAVELRLRPGPSRSICRDRPRPRPKSCRRQSPGLRQGPAYARGRCWLPPRPFSRRCPLRPQWPSVLLPGTDLLRPASECLARRLYRGPGPDKKPNAETLSGSSPSALQHNGLQASKRPRPGGHLRADPGSRTWVQVLEEEAPGGRKALANDGAFARPSYEKGPAQAESSVDPGRYPVQRRPVLPGACNYRDECYQEAITAFQRVIELEPHPSGARTRSHRLDPVTLKGGSSFFASLGSGYDSNVSYGSGTRCP
jgi:hypothetical protein